MELVERAYKELFNKENIKYNFNIKYSSKFKSFNANARMKENNVTFHLSRDWQTIDEDIVLGLIQELMIKLLTRKSSKPKNTTNIDVYNNFIRNLHIAIPKTKSHPTLNESFERVNDKYFYGMVEKPNLEFKGFSKTTLGSYNYQTDTISLNKMFEDAEKEIIDYIMYHEMLHKKLKYYNKNGRGFHHTHEFRKKEKEFENSDVMEKEVNSHIRRKKRNKNMETSKNHSSLIHFFHRKLFK